jgi:hypothetical protein
LETLIIIGYLTYLQFQSLYDKESRDTFIEIKIQYLDESWEGTQHFTWVGGGGAKGKNVHSVNSNKYLLEQQKSI